MDARILAAALLWLRNQYEEGRNDTPRYRRFVVDCVDALLLQCSPIRPYLFEKEIPMVDKVQKVMHEFKEGTLHSTSKKGPKVTSRKQAVAIALSEARKAGEKVKGKGKS